MKWLQRLAIMLALVVVSAPLSGCAAILSSLPAISSVVTDAMAVLEIIDSGAQEWFRRHPDMEKVRQAYLDAYAKAVNALNAASHALAGVKNITQEQFDAAFAEFRAAFADLRNILELNGVTSGNRLAVGSQTVTVPEPEALTYQVHR